jgi:hypothetical protein
MPSTSSIIGVDLYFRKKKQYSSRLVAALVAVLSISLSDQLPLIVSSLSEILFVILDIKADIYRFISF